MSIISPLVSIITNKPTHFQLSPKIVSRNGLSFVVSLITYLLSMTQDKFVEVTRVNEIPDGILPIDSINGNNVCAACTTIPQLRRT